MASKVICERENQRHHHNHQVVILFLFCNLLFVALLNSHDRRNQYMSERI